MSPRGFFRLGLVLGILTLAAGAAAADAHPTRPADATPRLYESVRLYGGRYVDAADFAARFGLKTQWLVARKKLLLANGRTRIELEADSRDFTLDGLRVFLGTPAVYYRDSLYVSLIDIEKLLTPILDPAGIISARAPAVRVIAIDPGHGGRDTGTQNHRLRLMEKTFTLDVAFRLEKLLQARGYRVVLTRTADRYVPLETRSAIANRAGADLFISIHFNSVENDPAVRGTETFALTPQFQYSTNDSRHQGDDDAALPGNKMDPWNALLGYSVHRHLLGALHSYDRGLKRARFKVLTLLNCPGILVESGYLSNTAEGEKINTPAYRADIAQAIANGVDAYAAAVAAAERRK